MEKIWLQDMTWEEAKEAIEEGDGVVLLPVGSIEQHAKHLPLGTDSYCAIEVCVDAAKNANAVVAPPIWYGWSIQHMAYPGTVSISSRILIDFTVEICKSLAKHGFNKILIVNGHRISNNPWIQLAATEAREATGALVIPIDIAYLAREAWRELGFGSLGHGDEAETSHMLYIKPDLVYMDRAFDEYRKKEFLYDVDPLSTKDTILYTPSSPDVNLARKDITGGGSGNPKASDRDKGEKLHKHIVKRLVELINYIRSKKAGMEL